MKHLWSVICLKYIISAESQSLSLIEITDLITFEADLPKERPLELPLSSPLYLVSTWVREVDTDAQIFDALMRAKPPGDYVSQEMPFQVDLTNTLGSRTFGVISTIQYTEDGFYTFEVCIRDGQDWKAVGAVPVQIVCSPPVQDSEDSEQQESEPA